MLRAVLATVFILALAGMLNGQYLVGSAPVPSPAATITWEIETVDGPRHFIRLRDRTLRIDSAGHPHLAFGGDALYYAHAEAAGWRIEVVDDNPGAGEYAALALDQANQPHIRYYDWRNGALKYAHRTASGWQIATVDDTSHTGHYPALALDRTGYAYLAYYDWTHSALKYARWDGQGWQIQTIDAQNNAGVAATLSLDDNDRPHISFFAAATSHRHLTACAVDGQRVAGANG